MTETGASPPRVSPSIYPWRLDIENAPKDGTVIKCVGRYANAAAGYPRYASWELVMGWCEMSRYPPASLVIWAWAEREEWPPEPEVTK